MTKPAALAATEDRTSYDRGLLDGMRVASLRRDALTLAHSTIDSPEAVTERAELYFEFIQNGAA